MTLETGGIVWLCEAQKLRQAAGTTRLLAQSRPGQGRRLRRALSGKIRSGGRLATRSRTVLTSCGIPALPGSCSRGRAPSRRAAISACRPKRWKAFMTTSGLPGQRGELSAYPQQEAGGRLMVTANVSPMKPPEPKRNKVVWGGTKRLDFAGVGTATSFFGSNGLGVRISPLRPTLSSRRTAYRPRNQVAGHNALGCAAADAVTAEHSTAFLKRSGRQLCRVAPTECKSYSFVNKRAETWWRFREALDPDQPGGSPIALPNDPAIRADLAAPRFKDTPRDLLLEEKAESTKRLGRSPDAGDAITLAWSEGQRAVKRGLTGPSYRPGGHNDRPDSYLHGRSATDSVTSPPRQSTPAQPRSADTISVTDRIACLQVVASLPLLPRNVACGPSAS